jgi:hypothetical protein
VGIPHQLTKALAAASADNIAASQSPGAGAILLNGSTSNRLSTTTTAATAAGLTVLSMTSVTGLVQGQPVSDSTAPTAIASGTTILGVDATNSKVILSQPVGGPGVGSGDTIVFAGTATLDTQRRVIVTSGGNDTGINFTVNGNSDNGTAISDTFAGASGAAAQSNLDFKTVTSVTHTGSVAGTVTVGTNTVGSTPWMPLNWHAQPFNVELSGQVTSGSANWGWQYTYQDPNNLPAAVAFPQPFNHPTLNGQTGSADGPINDPVAAIRLIVNSGTGTVLGTWQEAGLSGQ